MNVPANSSTLPWATPRIGYAKAVASGAAKYPGGAGGKNTADLTPAKLLLGSFLDLLIC